MVVEEEEEEEEEAREEGEGGEAGSFIRPAGMRREPMWISPDKKVPVQITTCEQCIISPVSIRAFCQQLTCYSGRARRL